MKRKDEYEVNTIQYQVTCRQTNLVKIQFLAMDDSVRGKYPNEVKPLYKTVEGYSLCSHFWPCYYPDSKRLLLPGLDASADRTEVTIPIMQWDGVQGLLMAVGAVCTDYGYGGDMTKVEPQFTDVHQARADRDGISRELAKELNFAEQYGISGRELADAVGIPASMMPTLTGRWLDKPNMQVFGDTHIGVIEKDPIVIHRRHGRKLEFERAADWSWIHFRGIDPKLKGKGKIHDGKYVSRGGLIKVRIASCEYPEVDTEDAGQTVHVYVLGTGDLDRNEQNARIDIPEKYRDVVAKAFYDYERGLGVTDGGESGWAVNTESLKRSRREMCRVDPVLVDYAKRGAEFTLKMMKSREGSSDRADAMAFMSTVLGIPYGKDALVAVDSITAVNAVNNKGDSGMIKQNTKQLVAELTAVKAAFATAVDAEVGDVDAAVAKGWQELKNDAKKSQVVVEVFEAKNAIPFLKQYDEVITILKSSADEVMTDDDINKSCACSLINIRSVERQMANLKANSGLRRITITRS